MPQDILLGMMVFALATLFVLMWLWMIYDLIIGFRVIAFGKDLFQKSAQRLGLAVFKRLEPWEKDRHFAAFRELPYHISPRLAKSRDAPLPASASLVIVASDKAGRVTFGLAPLPKRIQTPVRPYVVLASAMLPQPGHSGTAIVTLRGATSRLSPTAEPRLAKQLHDILPALWPDIRVIQRAKPWLNRTPIIDVGYSNQYAVIAIRICPTSRAAPHAYSAMYRILEMLSNRFVAISPAATGSAGSTP